MTDVAAFYKDQRSTKFWVDVLSEDESFLYRLDGVVSGKITCSTDARIKRGGQLSIVAKEPIDWWGRNRLRVMAEVNGQKWPLGVFIPSSPKQDHTASGVEFSVDINDKLLILDDDKLPMSLTIEPGVTLVDVVIGMIRDLGEKRINIPRAFVDNRFASPVNKRPLVWDAGTERLTVINDILDYIGYFSLTVDPTGQWVAKPYVTPAERPVSWKFFEGDKSLHSASYTHTQDLTNVPNRIVYITQPQEEQGEPLVSSIENHDPNSPFSYENRGRWITEVKDDAEAVGQAELDKMVKTRLENAMNPMEKVDLEIAPLPVELNDIADFRSGPYKFFGAVRKYELSLDPGGLMSVTLRRVNRAY